MTKEFSRVHAELWDVYETAVAQPQATHVADRLAKMREIVLIQKCPASLEAYERYLKLVGLHLASGPDLAALSLLDRAVFDAEMKRDPGRPFALLGMALTELKLGNKARGCHLLRRLAATRYRERDRAQALLKELVAAEVRA